MPRLLVGNFCFEHQLAGEVGRSLPKNLVRLNEEMATLLVGLADEGDLLWLPAEVDDGFFEQLAANALPRVVSVSESTQIPRDAILVPWGFTKDIRRWGELHGWRYEAPSDDVIRAVNSRRFSFQLESEWRIGLADSLAVTSVDQLADHLRSFPSDFRWVIKAEFGSSSRERCLGRGNQLAEPIGNWMQKRLRNGGALFFEPWVDAVAEAGVQFTIPRSGALVFEGVTPMLTDPAGHYRGNQFAADDRFNATWADAIAFCTRAARRIQAAGYFGPLGIDVMRYRDGDGNERFRPLQDVNARWTMGRVALGFRRILQPGETGTWRHGSWETIENSPSNRRIICTSPRVVDGLPTQHGSMLEIGRKTETL